MKLSQVEIEARKQREARFAEKVARSKTKAGPPPAEVSPQGGKGAGRTEGRARPSGQQAVPGSPPGQVHEVDGLGRRGTAGASVEPGPAPDMKTRRGRPAKSGFTTPEGTFDRQAHRREYMKAYRARKAEEGK